jgi:5-methylcytosine-specific restriction endonuclease McrA
VMLHGYFTEENHLELIEAACDKSKREIENLIAERFPREDIPSRMYEAKVLPGDRLPPPGLASPAFSGGQAPPACNERTIVEAISPGRHRVEFTCSAELRAKLEYARDLMRHSNPKGDLAINIERAVDLLIAKVERERFGKTMRPRTTSNDPLDQIARGEKIPADVRRVVAERDGYRCTFESADGWRRPARSFLQFDHIIPRARGGEHTVANVCLKCGVHNRLAAKKLFGRDYIEKKIAESQKTALLDKAGVEVSSLITSKLPESDHPLERNHPTRATRAESSSKPTRSETAARPQETMTLASPNATASQTKRRTFELVRGALVNLGFHKKDAVAALEEIDARIEPTSPLASSLEALLREALAVLT